MKQKRTENTHTNIDAYITINTIERKEKTKINERKGGIYVCIPYTHRMHHGKRTNEYVLESLKGSYQYVMY
jgi:hypothetical protein